MSYIINNPDIIRDLLVQHIKLAGIALLIAMAIALPLGLLISRYRWLAVPVLGVLGIFYTIPSLALIILLIPFPFGGLGGRTVIIALVIYAQVILVRNVLAGLQSINPAMIEAARGMGMNAWQTWWRVEFPLALPIIIAGMRIAAVVVIGIAAIGAKFGAGGLGRLLFEGISGNRADKIWAGAITVSALAFAVNGGLLALERAMDPTHRSARAARRMARAALPTRP